MDAHLKRGLLGGTDMMGAVISESCPKPKGCDDWVYRDIPWVEIKVWNMLADLIGEGHAKMLACTRTGNRARGQIWVSPEAAERLREYAERVPS